MLLPFLVLFALRTSPYLPFLSDDALISLRYARRLLDGFGLTWTDGHPVEGYSNLLWILAAALLGGLGIDLIEAVRLLGVGCMVSTMFALTWCYVRRPDLSTVWLGLVPGLSFLAMGAPISAWAIGGLEQPLLAALLALATVLTFDELDRISVDYGRTLRLSLVLGMICLTRPDGAIFAAATAFAVLVGAWRMNREGRLLRPALVLVFPLLLSAAQLVFRLAYYGEWVPNTALVKIAGSATHRTFGFAYLFSGFWALMPFSALAVAALLVLVLVRSTRTRGVFLSIVTIAWSSYVVFIGGDIFPAYRHLIPLMVVLAFAIAEAGALAGRATGNRPMLVAALAGVSLLALIPYSRAQSGDKWIRRAMTERWEWQGQEVALLLKSAFSSEQPRIAVTAAGSLPYWSELPALDMMGLSDYYLPRHRPADFGRGMVGHELGDGQYVLDQKPDVIIFDVGSSEPSWRTGDQLKKLPEFKARYLPVTVRTEPSKHRAVLFIDRNSSRIGIRRSASSITIPGFLFTGPDVVASLGKSGKLMTILSKGQTAQVALEVDPAVRWSIDASASGLSGVNAVVQQEGAVVTLTVPATGPVNLAQVVLVPAATTPGR